MSDHNQLLRGLPQVDTLALSLKGQLQSGPERVKIAREAVEVARQLLLAGDEADAGKIAGMIARSALLHRPVPFINATGVILHTNLGRAPLSERATAAARTIASGYSNAELDRETGERGQRGGRTRHLLQLLTGAEDALVVNNNAAAVLLTLAALAAGRSVPVSRGELIEIGGSYRLPDVMKASGANLAEVGTTNRTRIGDYETALQIHDCGMVLKVHNANYEISGFVEEVGIGEIAAVSRGVPVVFDIGSGLLDTGTPWLETVPAWVGTEPAARQSLDNGADLVLFSGDKMLGGPQAGILAGNADLIERIRRHPIARAVRVDSATDAALAATLESYAEDNAVEIPFWRMATATVGSLQVRVESVQSSVGGDIEPGESLVGAGSAPGARIESPVLRIAGRQDCFLALVQLEMPVLVRRDRGDLVLDLRTVDPGADEVLVAALRQCLS
ncbi:MAG: L-seryl-tRNA(Sec) selenium transferase [Acidimicrobiia bacterium]